jgi:hypothetical protein
MFAEDLALVWPPSMSGEQSTVTSIPSMMGRMKGLEAENARLRNIYPEKKLKEEILNEAIITNTSN